MHQGLQTLWLTEQVKLKLMIDQWMMRIWGSGRTFGRPLQKVQRPCLSSLMLCFLVTLKLGNKSICQQAYYFVCQVWTAYSDLIPSQFLTTNCQLRATVIILCSKYMRLVCYCSASGCPVIFWSPSSPFFSQFPSLTPLIHWCHVWACWVSRGSYGHHSAHFLCLPTRGTWFQARSGGKSCRLQWKMALTIGAGRTVVARTHSPFTGTTTILDLLFLPGMCYFEPLTIWCSIWGQQSDRHWHVTCKAKTNTVIMNSTYLNDVPYNQCTMRFHRPATYLILNWSL